MKSSLRRLTFEKQDKPKGKMQENEFKNKIIPLSSKLQRFACFFLENKDDARDVVQEVMLKLWQNRDSLASV